MTDDSAPAPTTARVEPPARPDKTSAVPSPLVAFDMPQPRLLTVSVGLWLLSGLVGFTIGGYFLYRLGAVRSLLETSMRAESPTIDDAELKTAIDITTRVTLVALGVLAELKLLLAFLMASRRNWARVSLVAVGVVGALVTSIGATVLTAGTVEDRGWLMTAIIAEQVLMLAGMATMFLPGPNRWFRNRLRV